jgi:two-component system cell cycle sensor histidine kinase/response regulator CckA
MAHVFNEDLKLEAGLPLSRTSQQIRAEIQSKFGFVPPFFEPAEQTPQVLENLWQQTLSAYVNNPLPSLFKEKLSAYLSRFCAVPYCMICHSCTLRPLGLTAQQVLELLEALPPVDTDIDKHLRVLAAPADFLVDGELDAVVEESLLQCSIFIALEREPAEHCRTELRRLLGMAMYQHLITFISYVKMCHTWMEAHPEVAYEADRRVQNNLSALLEDEPALADFFQNYREKVSNQCRTQAEQIAELAEQKHREEALRQQVEREHLMSEIAQRIRRSLNLEEILSTAVSEVRQFLSADRVLIYRFEPDWSGVVAVESVVPGCLSLQGTRITDTFFREASNREIYIQDGVQAVTDIHTANLARCHQNLLAQLQIRSNLVVPIVQGENLWGLLVANHCLEPRQWQPLELNLLKQLATQLAIAIQQSELYQQVQTELSERKQSEAKIRQQAALLDITTDAILVLTLDHQILFWNKGAEQLYGWTVAEAVNRDAEELLENAPQPEEIPRTVAETGYWQGELHQMTKHGKKIVVESRWTLMREADQPKSILVVNTDITQKKQLERQFLHAQRLENLGKLAGGVAHDLNNILTPILAVAQLLQLKLSQENQAIQQWLKIQEDSAKRGSELVKQMLSFAHATEGKRTVLEVKPLLMELKQIANETFPKSIEVDTELQPDLWAISADVTQLHQVLLNLCVNARDAMPNGGRLSLSAKNLFVDEHYVQMNLDAKAGPHIVISVKDTGTGISSEVLDKIFEPFFTTKEAGKGTGLGLSTAIRIVKNHGGFMHVYSEVGQGTQFKLYLPAVEGAEIQQADPLELPLGRGEEILVVDDEVAIREITKTSLETYNYKVLTAKDGIEATVLYAQHKDNIHAVLMDMMMPDMDGLTATLTLRKINPQVKIIAVSGLPTSDRVIGAMRADVNAFLSKPYTTQELLETLNSVLAS